MNEKLLGVWFFVIFIPSIYLVYITMQCFDYSKILKKGEARKFKILYLIISIIIAFLLALAFVTIIEKVAQIMA